MDDSFLLVGIFGKNFDLFVERLLFYFKLVDFFFCFALALFEQTVLFVFGALFNRKTVYFLLHFDKPAFHRIDFVHMLGKLGVYRIHLRLHAAAVFRRFLNIAFAVVSGLNKTFEAQKLNVQFEVENIVFKLAPADCFVGLNFKRIVRTLYFVQNGFHLAHIFFGAFKFAFGFGAFDFKTGNTRSFFEKVAPVFGFARQNLIDLSLLHNRIGGLSDAGVPKQFTHFAQFALLIVYPIFAFAGTVQAALNRNFARVDGQ